MPSRRSRVAALSVVVAAAVPLVPAGASAAPQAPGAPGATPTFAPADKHGFGTARAARSRVWFTLRARTMSEVYFPDLGTPAIRDLELVVDDGTRVERESTDANGRVQVLDDHSPTFRQTTTSKSGTWRAVKTYVTDPARRTVMIDVKLTALEGRRLKAWVLVDPQLSNDGRDDRADTRHGTLAAYDARAASALAASPAFTRLSSGYRGRSDGWQDLRRDGDLDHEYAASARRGNVAQVGQTTLTGRGAHRQLTLALGLGETTAVAVAGAKASLKRGFASAATQYGEGWHHYLDVLPGPPPAVAADPRLYFMSLIVLAASEDKAHPGASVASPSMPWAWGDLSIEKPQTGAYHLVWPRDLYQVATAQLAAGDGGAANRLLDFVLEHQKRDGTVAQNLTVAGEEHWKKLQMDQVALPIVLAWQLGRADAATWTRVRRAAEAIVRKGPKTEQERWENQAGWSPATIAAQIAGLICAADLARRQGQVGDAARYEAVADGWARDVQSWTATSTGPYSPKPYYLRITKDRAPDKGTTYKIGDSGPSKADQRAVVDPSFLELVRLGVKRADDPVIANTVSVVDQKLGVPTPDGTLWRRFSFDGYGEEANGSPWGIGKDDTFVTRGRAWPLFAGERGEYALARGDAAGAAAGLEAMAGTANDGLMLPEQAWDGRKPTGTQGRKLGSGTQSATPLAWTHAQYVRLAWSLSAGTPVERPSIVACRYAGCG